MSLGVFQGRYTNMCFWLYIPLADVIHQQKFIKQERHLATLDQHAPIKRQSRTTLNPDSTW
jgi:hypothetical protein